MKNKNEKLMYRIMYLLGFVVLMIGAVRLFEYFHESLKSAFSDESEAMLDDIEKL